MGYTLIANTAPRSNSDAEFRAWGNTVSNMFANSGMVKMTGVGEIDWSTVTLPLTTYTTQGYEIWRFNDALQSTAPVYFRLDYGSGAANVRPGMWFTLGNGMESNGNLMGARSPAAYSSTGGHGVWTSTPNSSNIFLTYFSGDTNRFALAFSIGGSAANIASFFFASAERTVDANGAATGDGVLLTFADQTQQKQVAWHRHIGEYTGVEVSWGVLMPSGSSGVSGSNTAVYPLFHAAGPYLNPGLNLLGYFNADFAANSSTSLTLYGASHTYMPLGNAALRAISTRAANPSCVMIRWE